MWSCWIQGDEEEEDEDEEEEEEEEEQKADKNVASSGSESKGKEKPEEKDPTAHRGLHADVEALLPETVRLGCFIIIK